MILSWVQRVAGGGAQIVARLRSLPNRLRIAVLDRAEARAKAELARSKQFPSVRERKDQVLEFYTQFESLVEVLCDAAQYGPDPHLEARYTPLRQWMLAEYPSIRRHVVAYLDYSPSDAAVGLESQGRGADAFEALFLAPTLAEFLRCDDGMMIARIMRSRKAINLYADHLRQLDA